MATLFEIDQAILDCIDEETGEVINAEQLDGLMIERNAKLEGIACWIKNLVHDAAGYKAQKEAFAERQQKAEKKIESLKNYLAFVLNGQKFASEKCEITFRKSQKVEVIDESAIPKQYINATITTKPDKNAIKDALKAGESVAGCSLIENISASVK